MELSEAASQVKNEERSRAEPKTEGGNKGALHLSCRRGANSDGDGNQKRDLASKANES